MPAAKTLKRNLLFGAILIGAATTAWFLTGCRDDGHWQRLTRPVSARYSAPTMSRLAVTRACCCRTSPAACPARERPSSMVSM
jgi:hypothetical protein